MQWNHRNAWIGVFDILGFKNKIRDAQNDFQRFSLRSKVEELFRSLDPERASHGHLEYYVFSDTYVILAAGSGASDYPWFLGMCKKLAGDSIRARLPMRGAISVGTVAMSQTPLIFMESAFLEAHEYCEAQNWIGLVLTPAATTKLREYDLEPLHHDFVDDPDIPLPDEMKKGVVAYRYHNGYANYRSHYLSPLAEMRRDADEKNKAKYDKTMSFIEKHYLYLDDETPRKIFEIV